MKKGLIYKVTSPSGKVYIGKTVESLIRRKDKHISAAFNKNSLVYNTKFKRAIRKYGNALAWEILHDNIPGHRLNNLEITVISEYDSFRYGYNSTLGGEGHLGYKHTVETKAKMSRSRKSKKPTPKQYVHILNMTKSKVGKSRPDEIKKKISKSKKGISVPNLSGEKNPRAKLTWNDVDEIRRKYIPKKYTAKVLASEYGVSIGTIKRVIYNKSWLRIINYDIL